MLEVLSLVLGPVATNAYLMADTDTREAVVIDPAWDGQTIVRRAQSLGWHVGQIWITHAHFDHFGGIGAVLAGCTPKPSIALHPADLPLWRMKGGSELFGVKMDAAPLPDVLLQPGQTLRVGQYAFSVRHTPGHSLGHVTFYCAEESLAFVGDTIFAGSVGRTDLPGGSSDALLNSIAGLIRRFPADTLVHCGHGPDTSLGRELALNPFLAPLRYDPEHRW